MNAHVHPIFQRLLDDMGRAGLLPADEQQAGTTLPGLTTAEVAAAQARRELARVVSPIPFSSAHDGQEL